MHYPPSQRVQSFGEAVPCLTRTRTILHAYTIVESLVRTRLFRKLAQSTQEPNDPPNEIPPRVRGGNGRNADETLKSTQNRLRNGHRRIEAASTQNLRENSAGPRLGPPLVPHKRPPWEGSTGSSIDCNPPLGGPPNRFPPQNPPRGDSP
jgi:hypothetical protein